VNAIRSTTSARVHHASRRRGWHLAARCARAAGDFDSSPHWFSLTWWPPHDGGAGSAGGISSGLKEYGWIEGQNISVEYRFAEGKEDALPGIAAELVRSRLDVIVAEGTAAIRAAKAVTQTIPIVMATSSDPVGTGLVASLNRPGGNVTGASLQTAELSGKRLQLLTEIVSGLAQVVVLSNPVNPSIAPIVEQTKTAAQSLGVELHVVEVQAPDKFESAFTAITSAHAGALIVLPDPLLYGQHPHIVTFTTASHLPALFPEKEVAEAGGLIAYGPSIPASFRRAAAYVDKILRGAKPADLPVEQPTTTFELVVNLRTARAIGVTIPTSILLRANEVIE
jgi:putative tryptophan/tyrosine transport system substrate-binding protein